MELIRPRGVGTAVASERTGPALHTRRAGLVVIRPIRWGQAWLFSWTMVTISSYLGLPMKLSTETWYADGVRCFARSVRSWWVMTRSWFGPSDEIARFGGGA